MMADMLIVVGLLLGIVFGIAGGISKKETDPAVAMIPILLMLAGWFLKG